MKTCICETCVHLKDVYDENGNVFSECEFGAPTPDCADCEEEGCEAECPHYQASSRSGEEKDVAAVEMEVVCCVCGKKLHQIGADQEEGQVFCVSCYLERDHENDD